MTIKHAGASDLESSLWSQSLRRVIKATLQADMLSVEDDENPFLWTLIVHPRSDYGRQFVSFGRAFFKSMLMYILQLKFYLEAPLLAVSDTLSHTPCTARRAHSLSVDHGGHHFK